MCFSLDLSCLELLNYFATFRKFKAVIFQLNSFSHIEFLLHIYLSSRCCPTGRQDFLSVISHRIMSIDLSSSLLTLFSTILNLLLSPFHTLRKFFSMLDLYSFYFFIKIKHLFNNHDTLNIFTQAALKSSSASFNIWVNIWVSFHWLLFFSWLWVTFFFFWSSVGASDVRRTLLIMGRGPFCYPLASVNFSSVG